MATFEEERYNFWCNNILGYSSMSRNQKKGAKRRYNKMHTFEKMNFLADCTFCSTAQPCANNNVKEKAMDKTNQERNYLNGRMDGIASDYCHLMRGKFFINDDPTPSTPQQIVERIQSSMVEYPTDAEWKKLRTYDHPVSCIRWRNPANKPDEVGYETAMDAFHASATPMYDAIAVLDPKDALVAVQEFEKATLH